MIARARKLRLGEPVQVREHVAQFLGVAAQVGGHVVQDRLLAEIELDHLRHVGVDRLVVGHPGADGIGQREVAAAVHAEHAGATQRAVGPEHLRVEEVVVDAAVDHVHPLRALRGAHEHVLVTHEQVLALDQFHAHLLGQEGMFEVGAVVHAGRQHHHGRLVDARGGHGAQRLQQQVGVMRHRRHAVQAEQFGEQPHHHLAIFEHVAHAAGHAQVVLEHVVAAAAVGIGGAHDVHAGDVRVHPARHLDAAHLGPVLAVVQHLLGRHQPGLEDLLVVVDVVQEAIQRGHALTQPFLHVFPLVTGDDARNQVEGDQPLGAGAVLVFGAVDGEGDADAAEDHLRLVATVAHQFLRLRLQPAFVGAVVVPHLAAADAHFIEAGWHAERLLGEHQVSNIRARDSCNRRVFTRTSRVCRPPPRITPRSGVTSP